MRRIIAVSVACSLGSGCASAAMATLPPARTIDADLQVGALAHRTRFEQDLSAEAPSQDPAGADTATGPAPPPPATDAPPRRHDTDAQQKRRNGLFWTGVVFTAVGGAGTVGFAAAGQGVEARLNDAYDGSLSREREDRLRDTGTLMNGLAIGSGALTVIGVGMIALAYGLDYTVCGKLAKRRKKCREGR